ncbi:hypothetical protein BpHYR1_013956 [Brachionus plicatilis]|uniref:Uncharacterized protein n=1 Tax=Brachionus plicatilis TaxID=10195 RepID=A0A3M7R3F8_BRAPC|nr:hypothetical protein BpHYR1_013956 [Brachionus plicatilis]
METNCDQCYSPTKKNEIELSDISYMIKKIETSYSIRFKLFEIQICYFKHRLNQKKNKSFTLINGSNEVFQFLSMNIDFSCVFKAN